MTEARCMKCRKQVEIKDGVETVTLNNMRILKGTCPECDTNVCRILGKFPTTGETEVNEDG